MPSPVRTLPPLPHLTVARHQSRHLLALTDDVVVDEVETLAVSRFAGARWDVLPVGVEPLAPAPRTAAPGEPGVLRTSRHTTLTGPYAPGPGMPPGTTQVFDVVCPRERGEPPYPGGGDRDGLARAFSEGLPDKEEARATRWLVDAARRLGGSVGIDVNELGQPSVVLSPDQAVTVDMTLYTDVWLEPDAAESVLQKIDRRVYLALEGAPWPGPPEAIAERPLYPGEKMNPEFRRRLHAEAEKHDIDSLENPPPLDGYGLMLDLGVDGIVAIEIGGEDAIPLLLRGLPWTVDGAVAYRLRWEPVDLVAAQDEVPTIDYRVARKRAGELVADLARTLHSVVGGEIADEAGFLVEPADL